MANQFSGKELKMKIRRRRLLLRDGQEEEKYIPPSGSICFTCEMTPEGAIFFSSFFKTEPDETDELVSAVERWMQANEEGA